MNKPLKIFMTLLGMSHLIVQGCSVSQNNNVFYPTIAETFSIDLNNVFKGENMTFINEDSSFRVVSYADPVDAGNVLRIKLLTILANEMKFVLNAIYSEQNNEEWSG